MTPPAWDPSMPLRWDASDPLNGFIAFLGSGSNTRGRFPLDLSELSADIHEWMAVVQADSSVAHALHDRAPMTRVCKHCGKALD